MPSHLRDPHSQAGLGGASGGEIQASMYRSLSAQGLLTAVRPSCCRECPTVASMGREEGQR